MHCSLTLKIEKQSRYLSGVVELKFIPAFTLTSSVITQEDKNVNALTSIDLKY